MLTILKQARKEYAATTMKGAITKHLLAEKFRQSITLSFVLQIYKKLQNNMLNFKKICSSRKELGFSKVL